MATHHGKEGKVLVGANEVAEVREFTYDGSAEVADDTAKGDTWNTHLVGHKGATGTVSCMYDPSDTNGQVVFVEGASLSLVLKPIGDDTGDATLSFTATVTAVGIASPLRDVVTQDFSYQVNGAVTRGTES